MKRTALLLGAAIALGFPQHGMADTETIAVTGESAGGVSGGIFFDFSAALLNNAGQVAFNGRLQSGVGGVLSINDSGLWLDNALIAREGSQAAGAPAGAIFSNFNQSSILNDAGQVAFNTFLLSGPGGIDSQSNEGIWLSSTLIAQEGNQADDTSAGALFSSFSSAKLNNAGQVAFIATLRTGGGGVNSDNDRGLWLDSDLIAREGNQAGGLSAGEVFSSLFSPVLNNVGQIAFQGSLRSGIGGVNSTNDSGIWRDSTLIAREGSQAGGVTAGAVFGTFHSTAINDAGQVVYEASLRHGVGGVDIDNDNGIWRDSTLIAREGNQAGGVPAGAVFHFLENPVINNAGHVAFQAFLRVGEGGVDNNNAHGIWRNSTLIARTGSQAEGAPTGAVYAQFSNIAINDVGQVAYEAFLRHGLAGVDSTNNSGIWITGTNGESLLVAREGNTLAGRTISSLEISNDSGGSDGRARAINNFSQLAYLANFTNGDEGVFLYTPDIHWTRTYSSIWDSSSAWTIGQRPGDPHDVYIAPDASLTVTGPTGDVALTNLTIGGNNGIATLKLNGGTITPNNAIIVTDTGVLTGDGTIDGDVTNNGTVLADNVTITGLLLNNNLISGNGRINADISNSGRIEAIGTPTAPADIQFDDGVSNNFSTGLIISRNSTMRFNDGLNNNGALAVSFGTSDIFGDITNKVTGSIVLSGGSNTTFYDDVYNFGSIVVAAAGTATSTAVFFGAVSGSGSITGGGNVFLHGDLRPGNSPAAVSHDVNLFLLGSATTQIEIGGKIAGTQHDQINNAKTTTLGGTLDIQLIDGYDPEQGDTFDIFNFASHSGTFANVLLPTLDSDLGWHLGKLYSDGELHVELAGDLNLDGFVGLQDLEVLLANWGNSALAFDYAAGDASGDGLVGAADLALVQANWGHGTPGGDNVPEPSSAALFALGGLALLRRTRR